ncbi:UNVERIFIED_CONTAM: hypothetical protein FKN15_007595 [Acipenser sinensis]
MSSRALDWCCSGHFAGAGDGKFIRQTETESGAEWMPDSFSKTNSANGTHMAVPVRSRGWSQESNGSGVSEAERVQSEPAVLLGRGCCG